LIGETDDTERGGILSPTFDTYYKSVTLEEPEGLKMIMNINMRAGNVLLGALCLHYVPPSTSTKNGFTYEASMHELFNCRVAFAAANEMHAAYPVCKIHSSITVNYSFYRKLRNTYAW
jgi:hypothetical protein